MEAWHFSAGMEGLLVRESVARTAENRDSPSLVFSRPFHGLISFLNRIPALKCWAISVVRFADLKWFAGV